MKHNEMLGQIKQIFNKVTTMHVEGQKEYAMDEDNVFANFDRVASSLEISREQALMTYLLKHIDGISSYIKGHKSQREDVSGRITDAIVYLFLLWAMVDGVRELDAIKEPVSRDEVHSNIMDSVL